MGEIGNRDAIFPSGRGAVKRLTFTESLFFWFLLQLAHCIHFYSNNPANCFLTAISKAISTPSVGKSGGVLISSNGIFTACCWCSCRIALLLTGQVLHCATFDSSAIKRTRLSNFSQHPRRIDVSYYFSMLTKRPDK